MRIRLKGGQSLIELIMVLPILIGFWAAIIWFARVFILDIELLHTARHGIFWLAYQNDRARSAHDEKSFVERECANFFQSQDPSINLSHLTIEIEPGDRWKPVPFGMLAAIPMFYLLGNGVTDKFAGRKIIERLAGVNPNAKPAKVALTYVLDTPPILRAIPGFPSTIPLRGTCVCYR